ncbi:MAG TPA: SOS response-associated peptidase [Mycobacteriales bacterium]|nr:SOS response-associated peptidase [Mycobacteriales bacterium]
MCGRYASAMSTPTLLETFSAVDDTAGAVEESYNVAPTDPVPVVLVRRNKETDEDVRLLRVFRWGLVPSWAKDLSVGARMINARLETLTTKPAFRKAIQARRCIVPADGYYEWLPPEEPRGKKLPVYIHRADGGALAMAGIYEVWSDAAGNRVWSTSVITTDAVDELGHIHDRSPVLLEPDMWAAWLDPHRTDPEPLLAALGPPPAGLLSAHRVSTAVNDVRNDGPQLREPIDPAAEDPQPTLL